MSEYIVDDRNMDDRYELVRNMSDEEFEAYIAKLRAEREDASLKEKTA